MQYKNKTKFKFKNSMAINLHYIQNCMKIAQCFRQVQNWRHFRLSEPH